jgi:hypothetical protein
MKKVNNILKMISKMESNANEIKLAKHEVELGLLQDAQKMVTASEKAWLAANQKLNIINAKAKEAVDALIKAQGENASALKLVNTLISNTKDLGLPISPESQKMFDMLSTRSKSLNDGIAAVKQVNVQQIKG